jgi:preprotein translocase subunit SecG
MYQIIIVVHVLLGLSVIGFVLIQQGKGADAGAAFGSASSGSVFGAQGASSFLSRTTAILATLFFATSLGLAILVGHQDGEVDLMDKPEVEEVFADVPLIDGGDNTPATESVPVLSNDVPATIIEDVQSTTETTEIIIEETQPATEETETVTE